MRRDFILDFPFSDRTAYIYPTTFDKDKVLETNPSYADQRFKKDQTVFGKKSKGLSYDYSDRLWEWDYAKAEASAKVATESGAKLRTCRWYEAYLSAYFGRPIEIGHIMAGVNVSNGYSYCIFGYKNAAPHTPENEGEIHE